MLPAMHIDIGRRLELFVDGEMIEELRGPARLRIHHPERREVAVLHDAPWEGCGCGYHTVFRDGPVCRMYYHAWHIPEDGAQKQPVFIGYCESRDGILWEKPDLGLVEYQGSRANNIILDRINAGGCHDFAPFRDTNPGCRPGEEYKAVGFSRDPKGLCAFASSDAIRWSLMNGGQPVMTGHPFDTQNLAFWDPGIGKYRAYVRDATNGLRRIMTATSADFITWSPREWLEFPGAPAEALYTNQVAPYYRAPNILLGFPARYVDRGWVEATHELPSPDLRKARSKTHPRYGSVVTDGLLMASRDGLRFHRWNEAFLRPGLRTRHNWAYGDNYIAWGMLETEPTGDDTPRELSLFATESYFTGTWSRLRRLALRIDGFGSLFAPLEGGEAVTKPLVFDGRELVLNVSTSAGGSAFVELQDAAGAPVPGFALDECHEIFGDHLEYVARWKGGRDAGSLAGRPVRLRFRLKDADVFSFRFR